MITAIILTHNEEQHIERCIKSIKDLVSDIVVVDSYSDDKTVELALSLGARVYKNVWINYATQFQWGLENTDIKSDWIFRIDADEYLESKASVILDEINNAGDVISGFNIRRKYYFLDKWIKYGAMYPIHVLRLWKKSAGRIESRWMDEHIILTQGEARNIDVDIVDDNKNNISWWIDKHNSYATREMIDILNMQYQFISPDNALIESQSSQAKYKRVFKERFYSKLPIFIRPLCYFLYRYILRLGMLDGVKGFAFHFMQGYWYRSLVDLKVLEAKKWLGDEIDPDKIKFILEEKTGLKL